MKLGRKLVACLLVLTLVVAFCGFMASAANGNNGAYTKFYGVKKLTGTIYECGCAPRSNTLTAQLEYQLYQGTSYFSLVQTETNNSSASKEITTSDPIHSGWGHYTAKCKHCGSDSFTQVAKP